MTKCEALQQRHKLIELIRQWTRAEIMARLVVRSSSGCADYFAIKLRKEDEIRQLVFNESSLVKLANEWEMLE